MREERGREGEGGGRRERNGGCALGCVGKGGERKRGYAQGTVFHPSNQHTHTHKHMHTYTHTHIHTHTHTHTHTNTHTYTPGEGIHQHLIVLRTAPYFIPLWG